MTARDIGHVEEIINHLKRVESDYGIDLTSEMEWLRGLMKEEQASEVEAEKKVERSIPDIVDEHFYEMLTNETEWFGKTVESKSYKLTARYFAEWGKRYKEPVSEDLEKEIQDYYNSRREYSGKYNAVIPVYKHQLIDIARHFTNWQKQQDDKILNEKQWEAWAKGGEEMKQELMKGAKNGVVCDSNDYIKFDDGTWIELDPTMQLNPAFALKDGDKVKVIVIKED